MSTQWWNTTAGPSMPAEMERGIYAAQIRFYAVQRLLHLPFLLESFSDPKRESSRVATLDASRQIIRLHGYLRSGDRPLLQMCDMADFQVFAAAMTLVIDLLACSRPLDRSSCDRKEYDWGQVLQTAERLASLARSMEGCTVAALGARVLNDFLNLRDGSSKICKVDIPYFGRVEIQPQDTPKQSALSKHKHALEGFTDSAVSDNSFLFPPSAGAEQPWDNGDDSWTSLLNSNLTEGWNWSLHDDWPE